jgi:chromosome partitioning protein
VKTLAIISQKGGTGKTTLAINLAVASERAGKPAVIIDLDPQASAKAWHDNRQEKTPTVISAQAARLPDLLATAKTHGAALVIIDTAPHSETASLAAARAADLILIPCRPGILDIRAIATSADLAALSKTPALAVLTACPYRGTLPDEAKAAIKTYGLAVAPVQMTHRSAFVHSLTASQAVMEYAPEGSAAAEVRQLYRFTVSQLDKPTPSRPHKSTRKERPA